MYIILCLFRSNRQGKLGGKRCNLKKRETEKEKNCQKAFEDGRVKLLKNVFCYFYGSIRHLDVNILIALAHVMWIISNK